MSEAIEKRIVDEENVARVRDLLQCMERGDEEGAREIVDELANVRETTLYQEVGKLTRELHDAISAFGMDDRIANLAEHDIPDARERLNYVIAKTDEAANRTLTAIEESLPLCEKLESESGSLHERWQQFRRKELNIDDFRELSRSLEAFLAEQHQNAGQVRAHLTDALMAQDFQDLTGQIIKRVITLVEEVEANLVNLIKVAGLPERKQDGPKEHDLDGPVIPGKETASTVSGQDEVDDLLSSLGF